MVDMKYALSFICMSEFILPIEFYVLTQIKSDCKQTQRDATHHQKNGISRLSKGFTVASVAAFVR